MAWNKSPGGKWGAVIHWLVNNWIPLVILIGLIPLAGITIWLIRSRYTSEDKSK